MDINALLRAIAEKQLMRPPADYEPPAGFEGMAPPNYEPPADFEGMAPPRERDPAAPQQPQPQPQPDRYWAPEDNYETQFNHLQMVNNPHTNYNAAGQRTVEPEYNRQMANEDAVQQRGGSQNAFRNAIYDYAQKFGADPSAAGMASDLSMFVPGLGDMQDIEDVGDAASEGRWWDAALGGVAAAVPFIPARAAMRARRGRGKGVMHRPSRTEAPAETSADWVDPQELIGTDPMIGDNISRFRRGEGTTMSPDEIAAMKMRVVDKPQTSQDFYDAAKWKNRNSRQVVSYADYRKNEEALGPKGELFDYTDLHKRPDVPQSDLERYVPKHGTSKRMEEALLDPEVMKRLDEYVMRGQELGGDEWYNTQPFRQIFVDEFGEENAAQAYANYMDIVAATSPRSNVPDNVRTASYYWNQLANQGDLTRPLTAFDASLLPEKPPPGYGSVAQNLHRGNVTKLTEGGMDLFDNPKPISFSQNLQGNWRPTTIDTHNFRPVGMIREDPSFMMGSFNPEKGVTLNPKKDFNAGDLSMEQALDRPVFWQAKPRKNEYGAYEAWQQQRAAELGMEPAQYQSNMWIGAGDLTGLQSPPEPFLRTLESRVQYTANLMGLEPEEVMRRHVRGEIPLLQIGGAAAAGTAGAAAGMNAMSDDEEINQLVNGRVY